MATVQGSHDVGGLRIGIVVARFNDFVTTRLLTGAREALAAAGVGDDAVDVVWVPGAFEVPAAAQRVALTRGVAAVICLGCVIRGGTPHFDYICSAAAHGVTQAASLTGVPMTFGILTTDSVEQARIASERANRPLTPEAFRKQVSRARRLMAECILLEVARGVIPPTPTAVEAELHELGLWERVHEYLPSDWREKFFSA